MENKAKLFRLESILKMSYEMYQFSFIFHVYLVISTDIRFQNVMYIVVFV